MYFVNVGWLGVMFDVENSVMVIDMSGDGCLMVVGDFWGFVIIYDGNMGEILW